jgi:hypothetical protein
MEKTIKQYTNVTNNVYELFEKKQKDYDLSWRILRPKSLTDQIFTKASRIRTIEEKGTQEIYDSIDGEYIGIINYSIMAIINLRHGFEKKLTADEANESYKEIQEEIFDLMKKKNSDYGEVWREMRISSLTDFILQNLVRLRSMEDKKELIASEGSEAKYKDIVNYSIFALIRIEESKI